jgi:hypothetical protein
LLDHAVGRERAQYAVHRGVGQVESGGQIAEAEATRSLERQQDADRSVNALDHAAIFLEEILLTARYQKNILGSYSTLSNTLRILPKSSKYLWGVSHG